MSHEKENQMLEGIAIVGMAGRFPGSKNIAEFWSHLQNGNETISDFTEEELKAAGVDPDLMQDPQYVKRGGLLQDRDLFDANFFDYTAKEAEVTDPSHRLFLETAWEALETAGYDAEQYPGRIGVYGGVGQNSFSYHLYGNPGVFGQIGALQATLATSYDFLATRVAYKLNLTGPAITLQTACSTSLVAVHQACQQLLMHECDMALAGGVAIKLLEAEGYLYQEGSILSPDGHCRAFDEQAQGTIGGDGVGVVVLKRLEDALEDGDSIYAVIRGSAVNNDGAGKIGFTAPSVDGQAQVILDALAVAGVEADSIAYIETHGTGTPLGDPIEIAALTNAYRESTDRVGYCALGSLKTNIGHLDAAAGVTGLIKAALMLQHGQLVPSLHFEKANPKLGIESSPFYVNTELKSWTRGVEPRRAGVSSFGMGGTNAHVVLEEAPHATASSESSRKWKLLVLSAKTGSALNAATENLAAHLQANPQAELADVAFTLQTGRRAFDHRRVVAVESHADAVAALEAMDSKRVLTGEAQTRDRSVVFLFPGQGAQYVNMGLDLYREEPVFREQVDACAEALQPTLGVDLRDVLYPSADRVEQAGELLRQTYLTQPALFVIEYALAKLWMELGVQPDAMLGHSIGEYVAAVFAGVMSLEDALQLVAMRGKLMQSLPEGTMLAVPLTEAEVLPLLGAGLSLAAVNGPRACVVAGTTEAVQQLEAQLQAQEVECRRLVTSHAFHSEMMDPILAAFAEAVQEVELHAPQLAYLSNVSGTWITAEEATDPAYWVKHLRGTVRFADNVRELLQEPGRLFLEVGPGRSLIGLTRQQVAAEGAQEVLLSSLRHRDEQLSDAAFLLTALGKLWLSGLKIDWTLLYPGETRHRLALPTYPFERKRYWLERKAGAAAKIQRKKADIADWFYVPTWKKSLLIADEATDAQRWLLFLDETGTGAKLAERLTEAGHRVVTVAAGASFAKTEADAYTVHPAEREDYSRLFDDLAAAERLPQKIVHLFGVTDTAGEYEETQAKGFYSLLGLAQALGEQTLAGGVEIGVITNNLQEVLSDTVTVPARATALGLCKVIPQELTGVTARAIDIDSATDAALLIAELSADSADTVVAYRRSLRFVQTYEAVRLPQRSAAVHENAVVLITGANTPNGQAAAAYFEQHQNAKLVLITHDAEATDAHAVSVHVQSSDAAAVSVQSPTSNSIEITVQPQLATGASSQTNKADRLYFTANITDLAQIQSIVQKAAEQFGEITGVIHAEDPRGTGMLQLKTQEMTAAVLDPKVKGALVLEQALADAKLDFFLLYNSTVAATGGFGQSDNCAAGAFLDAFAAARARTHAINWGIWKWDDWQEQQLQGVAELAQQLRETRETFGITEAEGWEALTRVLSFGLPQTVVSTQDFHDVLQASQSFTAAGFLEALEESRQAALAGAQSNSNYVAPRNDLETTIAGFWAELFGVQQPSVQADFFDLGGNSLVAIQLVTRMRKQFGMDFPINTIFESPTIEALAQMVESNQLGQEKIDALEDLLKQIEGMSDEDLLAKMLEEETK
ncbi:acyl transferase domain-containing protein [Tumebacillus sp. BK434]|uniref:type I polyketide synthase n=1 Tax=Tumebacillus sp. BK434 TaxID=2512169 RepID=UPI00104E7D37|nr:type I polyketide synthase [Tumebacillus sp. BK434]TCP54480.1 acyl transferase domain-containing protein [Tumebacillus sp. BK434]